MNTRLMINPQSEAHWLALRVGDVTSTESSALFGMCPYATHFELWHRKHDKTDVSFSDNERIRWGNYLQEAIARGFGEEHGLKVRAMPDYIRIIEAKMGASFDFEIIGIAKPTDSPLQQLFLQHGPGILEIKNVDRSVFYDSWSIHPETKAISAPGHIEIQLQHQLHVADRAWGSIGVLVGGNAPKVIARTRDAEVGEALEWRVRNFWSSVEKDAEPPARYPDDAEFICKLYGYAEPGRVFDGRGNEKLGALFLAHRDAADRARLADEDKKTAQAKILQIIGDAERVQHDEFSLWAGVVGPAEVAFTRKGYRGFKLERKKAAPRQDGAR